MGDDVGGDGLRELVDAMRTYCLDGRRFTLLGEDDC
jgi:hypothetical protein